MSKKTYDRKPLVPLNFAEEENNFADQSNNLDSESEEEKSLLSLERSQHVEESLGDGPIKKDEKLQNLILSEDSDTSTEDENTVITAQTSRLLLPPLPAQPQQPEAEKTEAKENPINQSGDITAALFEPSMAMRGLKIDSDTEESETEDDEEESEPEENQLIHTLKLKILKGSPILPKSNALRNGRKTYLDMVMICIKDFDHRAGTTLPFIKKYMTREFNIDFDDRTKITSLHRAIKLGMKKDLIMQTKGIGMSGSFRLVKNKNPKTTNKKQEPAPAVMVQNLKSKKKEKQPPQAKPLPTTTDAETKNKNPPAAVKKPQPVPSPPKTKQSKKDESIASGSKTMKTAKATNGIASRSEPVERLENKGLPAVIPLQKSKPFVKFPPSNDVKRVTRAASKTKPVL